MSVLLCLGVKCFDRFRQKLRPGRTQAEELILSVSAGVVYGYGLLVLQKKA